MTAVTLSLTWCGHGQAAFADLHHQHLRAQLPAPPVSIDAASAEASTILDVATQSSLFAGPAPVAVRNGEACASVWAQLPAYAAADGRLLVRGTTPAGAIRASLDKAKAAGVEIVLCPHPVPSKAQASAAVRDAAAWLGLSLPTRSVNRLAGAMDMRTQAAQLVTGLRRIALSVPATDVTGLDSAASDLAARLAASADPAMFALTDAISRGDHTQALALVPDLDPVPAAAWLARHATAVAAAAMFPDNPDAASETGLAGFPARKAADHAARLRRQYGDSAISISLSMLQSTLDAAVATRSTSKADAIGHLMAAAALCR